ncbi:MAG: hypothetical protein ABI169_15850, partial [Chitinophagaceae bacterium]
MSHSNKFYPLLPIVKHFITKSRTGKRLQPNGKRISAGTVVNYTYLYKHLEGFEQLQVKAGHEALRIRAVSRLNAKELIVEKNYWKRFYSSFLDYLYSLNCYDNYVGSQIKRLRCVFRYAELELMISVGSFYKLFHVPKEEVPIITLHPERLSFLIENKKLSQGLSEALRIVNDIFVFGCTVALRFSDLIAIRKTDIQMNGERHYLVVRAQKTGTVTRVPLPKYALDIIARQSKNGRQTIFAPINLVLFNARIRQLCEQVGWTEEIGKERSKRGEQKTFLHPIRN